MYKKTISFFVLFLLISCTSPDKKTQPDVSPLPTIEQGNAQSREFFASPRTNEELFRVYASDRYYQVEQYANQDSISLKEDMQGNSYFQEKLKPFNRINYFGYAILKIELHPDSGKIARVRPIRSSGIKEIDKLIFDDILRFQFIFTNKKIEAQVFNIAYAIHLEKLTQTLETK